METTTHKKQFSIRSEEDVHRRLLQAAEWRGQTLHAFVLGAATQAADEVLSQRERIQLTAEDAEMILQQLSAEPEENEALSKAFQHRAELLGE